MTFYFDWEVCFSQWVQSYMGGIGVKAAEFFTLFGEEAILILIFGLLYWCIDKKTAKSVGTCLMVALIANPMIKNAFLRRRPYFDHESIKCLKPVAGDADPYDISAQGYSFPSGHSGVSSTLYGSFMCIYKNPVFRVLMLMLIFMVGLSRVALGVHYATDVLAGWAQGVLIVLGASFFRKRVKNLNLLRLVIFIISLTGMIYCRTDDYFSGIGLMAGFFLAIPFEERFVSFPETRDPVRCILRIAGGLIGYVCINKLLKLPFSGEFFESGTMAAYLVRSLRYTIIMFVLMGIYPMIFGKIGKKEELKPEKDENTD